MGHIADFVERATVRARHGNYIPIIAFYGDVLGYDPATDRVRVKWSNQYDGASETETHIMPIARPLAGASYGQQAAPEAGTQCLVLQMTPSPETGDVFVALGFTFTTQRPAPGGISPGEWLVANKSSPSVAIKSAADGTIQVGAIPSITGNPNRILREKDLYPLITALNTARAVFNAHVHSGVSTGAGVSGAPTTTEAAYTNPSGSTTAKAGD